MTARLRGAIAALTLIAAASVLAAPAAAAPPTRITIVAVFEPITFGEDAYVNGQLMGDPAQVGQPVQLEQSPPPFTVWTPVATVASDADTYYSFKIPQPSQTMRYRTSSQGVQSNRAVQVSVAPRITFSATRAGAGIRFSGTFAPALPGRSVAIQRRKANGSWATIARPRLAAGTSFAGRIRWQKAVTLRAFYRGDAFHRFSSSAIVRVRGQNAHTATQR